MVLSRGGDQSMRIPLLEYNRLCPPPRSPLGGNLMSLAPLWSILGYKSGSSWWGSWPLGRLQGTHCDLWSPGSLLSGCSLGPSHHFYHLCHFLDCSFCLFFLCLGFCHFCIHSQWCSIHPLHYFCRCLDLCLLLVA